LDRCRHAQSRSTLVFLASLDFVGVIVAVGKVAPARPAAFNGKAYGLSVALEAVLILVAVLFLRSGDRKRFLLPIISIIVGLHFFGLVWALGSNEYWFVGSAMCSLSILTMSLLPRNLWDSVVGLGCAVILWFSVICAFF
jgi:NAD/NADP transhydrogenase beta subunit